LIKLILLPCSEIPRRSSPNSDPLVLSSCRAGTFFMWTSFDTEKSFSQMTQRNWVIATKLDFLIPISSHHDGVNLWYYKLYYFDLTEFRVEISNFYHFGLQRYKDLKIRVCGKDSIPLVSFEKLKYQSNSWSFYNNCWDLKVLLFILIQFYVWSIYLLFTFKMS